LPTAPTSPTTFALPDALPIFTAFSYDAARGTLTWIQTVSTLPPDFTGPRSCAEIRVHPNGKFVYGSNRGHDSIVGFEIDQATGKDRKSTRLNSNHEWSSYGDF